MQWRAVHVVTVPRVRYAGAMTTTKKRTQRPPPALARTLEPPIHLDGVTYQQKFILCSKPTCSKWHGPYWYAFYKPRVDPTSTTKPKTKSKYIGRNLPATVREQAAATPPADDDDDR